MESKIILKNPDLHDKVWPNRIIWLMAVSKSFESFWGKKDKILREFSKSKLKQSNWNFFYF